MKITDVWSLHFKDFLIQIEGTEQDAKDLEKWFKEMFKDKRILIVIKS
jgi:hypothetical protein